MFKCFLFFGFLLTLQYKQHDVKMMHVCCAVSGHYARNIFVSTQAEIQILLFRKTWWWVEDYCMFMFVWAVPFKAGVFTLDFPLWTRFTFQQKLNSSEMGKLVSWWKWDHSKCVFCIPIAKLDKNKILLSKKEEKNSKIWITPSDLV